MDVHYGAETTEGGSGAAHAAAIGFLGWAAEEETERVRLAWPISAAYEPGAFYKREAPPLLAGLRALKTAPDLVIVDGYVSLGAEAAPGLGFRVYEALGSKTPVVGVAKTRYRGTPDRCALRRGGARTPLFVTAVGLPLEAAKAGVAEMSGPHRLPAMLRRVDQLSRGLIDA